MDTLKRLLPSKIFEVIDRAGICTAKEILILSKWDIKKLTNLNIDDILYLKSIVADYVSPESLTGDMLLLKQRPRISSGCEAIDKITSGGFRTGTLTEIFGESGSGKTQIGLQAAANTFKTGSVFICTEDVFPVKRLKQIQQSLPNHVLNDNIGKNIFIEHVTEPSELLSCVKVRLPRLLNEQAVSLIVVDSIAAPHRTETTNYVQRAEDLRELAVALIAIAKQHNIAIICINQVTMAFDGTDKILPCLGLAWSNLVSTRIMLKKTSRTVVLKSNESSSAQEYSHIRELSVVFAPDLPNETAEFIITSNGIVGI
ncbi:DNA repair protein XRCC3-like [Leguminivora glycinivorella]|uniref:DNA repair protein XRCC3-like n=1 Tax=Leguminivora glycinivorella TaxID=1035111 RepID=UPI00200F3EFE|nr:DNA repair protein XRCC3-like [Leguminivora glycinivorella]